MDAAGPGDDREVMSTDESRAAPTASGLRVTLVAVGALLLVVILNLTVFLFFFLPPLAGFVWVAGVGAAFVWWHLRPGPGGGPTEVTRRIRVGPPRVSGGWLAGMVVFTFLFMTGILSLVQMVMGPIDLGDSPFHRDVLAFTEDLAGWLVFALAAAVVIPIIEEFAFRGRLQGFLEPQWGPGPAILFAAVLFAIVHVGGPHPILLVVPLVMGVFLGLAVHLTGSIWSAVLLHGAWNGVMTIMTRVSPDEAAVTGEVPEQFLGPATILLVVAGGLGWGYLIRVRTRTGARRGEGEGGEGGPAAG
jgi:membrane protease YdiL (CAAX protease family)